MIKHIVSAFLSVCALTLYAQYSSELDVNVYNRPVMYIEMSAGNLDFGDISPDMSEINRLNAVSMVIKSNVDWTLTLESRDDLISVNGDTIPSERLSVRTHNNEFTALPVSMPVVIASGKATGSKGVTINMDFRLNIEWNDPSGQFNTKLIFSLNSIY